jgi:primosomal protein N' (replication factor Y)
VSDRLVSVAVPVAVDRGFTYRVPAALDGVVPGARVLVPFGTRALVGVVRPVQADAPEGEVREIHGVMHDGAAALPPEIVDLCEWMSDYYVAPIGEVYRAALPGLLANADARVARLTEAGRRARYEADAPLLSFDATPLDAPHRRLLEAIAEAGELPVPKLAKLRPKIPGVLLRLAELERDGLCETEWSDEGASTRTETFVRRTGYLRGGGADEDALQRLVGRSKQRRALLDWLEARTHDEAEGWVALGELRGPFPRVRELLSALVDADLVVSAERPRKLDPFDAGTPGTSTPQHPTHDQEEALRALAELDGRFGTALLHGITGSGKTEVYLQHIARLREQDRGAIVLVPEIALTPQLADRFRARFGDAIAVLHSALTPRQRLDAWQQIRAGERPIVIGARSAIFAPVPRLGTIVVDEEHDGSFKQEEGVRYNARDVALVRAKAIGASVVLGSATPSLESYEHARSGRWLHLRLRERPTPRPLPTVEIVPLSVHRADPESHLTARLRDAVRETVEAGEQAILFLNRRGFTTTLVCEDCGSLQQCPDCSAPSLTYHLSRNRLMCHLCGHLEATPQACRVCGSARLTHAGAGTERVEVAVARALEGVRVLRLDRDTSRGRALIDTLAKFRRREADVLVGTQMLSKGHDFPGVTLVGILQGDHGLGLPDLRAAERTFALLTQVAGRAGRGDRAGRVLVQAWAIEHPAIRFAAKHDFEGFAEVELAARKRLGNPPHGHLALVRVQGLEQPRVAARAKELAKFLREGIAKVRDDNAQSELPIAELLGPTESPIARINRRCRWQLLLRTRTRAPLRWLLAHLRDKLGPAGSGAAQTTAIVDVDPQSLL